MTKHHNVLLLFFLDFEHHGVESLVLHPLKTHPPNECERTFKSQVNGRETAPFQNKRNTESVIRQLVPSCS